MSKNNNAKKKELLTNFNDVNKISAYAGNFKKTYSSVQKSFC